MTGGIHILNELKQNYRDVASQLKNWNKISQIELANLYDSDHKNRDVYLSALVIRYWNIFSKAAYQGKDIFSPEDAYEWYIDSVLRVLEDKPWNDEKSTLYKDEKAFEKAVNVRFFCTKVNWFQASNRHRRKINHDAVSLDKMVEDYADSALPVEFEDKSDVFDNSKEMVVSAFRRQRYLMSLVVDLIMHDIDTSVITNDNQLIGIVRRAIKNLPEHYSGIFSDEYSLDEKKVVDCFKSIYHMSDRRLRKSIEKYIYDLRMFLSKED